MKIELLVTDLDGTLVSFGGKYRSSWEAVAKVCGKSEEYTGLLNKYYSKKDKVEEWTSETARLFRGLSVEKVHKDYPELPYNPGVREFFRKIKIPAGILSSGINIIAERVKRELKMDFLECSHLEVKDGILTGKLLRTLPLWSKEKALRGVLQVKGLNLEQVCYIGDNDNDVACVKEAGIGVAFIAEFRETSCETLAENADYLISDFMDLEKILGK